MDFLIDIYSKTRNLHHAYIIEGEPEATREILFEFLEKKLEHPTTGNPDFWYRHYETLSIDDARELRDAQSRKALGNNRKIFVIELKNMTIEAQNSLLKIFEEPTPDTHFFILVSSAEIFLPTLRSRVFILRQENDSEGNKDKNFEKTAKDFLQASHKERLEIVSSIAEEKDKTEALKLIDSLLLYLNKKKYSDSHVFRELLKTRMYLHDRSPSLKLLLEHCALMLPSM